MSQNVKEWALRLGKFILAFGLVFWLISRGLLDLSLLGQLLQGEIVLVLLGLAGLNLILANWRWTLLLRARGFSLGFLKTFPLYLIGLFFNYALPGAIGGDVVKAYYLTKDHPRRKIEAVTTVAMDRILGLYAMVLLALVAILVDGALVFGDGKMQWVALLALSLFLGMTLFFILAFSRWLRDRPFVQVQVKRWPGGSTLLGLYESIHAYREHGPVLLGTLGLSLLSQTVAVLFMWFVGQSLGYTEVSWITYLFAVPTGFMLSALPISPAGVGVGQVAFLFLFNLHMGAPTDLGPAVITAFQIALFVWGLVGAGFYLMRKQKPEESLSFGGYDQNHHFAQD